MTPYDDVLLWASERGNGSLASLKASAAWAVPGRPPGDVVDDLQALGHVDVRDGRWQVLRPALSLLAHGGGNGLMLGARPRWLVEAIDRLDEAENPALASLGDELIDNLRLEQPGPAAWYVSFSSTAVVEHLGALGIQVVKDLAGGLLTMAERQGRVGLLRTVRPGELVARAVATGGADVVQWEPVRSDREPGAYVYLRNNQRIYASRTSEGWLECSRRWTEWTALGPSTQMLWAAPREWTLYCRAGLRPPLEVERSLILRTGRLPRPSFLPGVVKSPDVLRFDNVPFAVAQRVARVLDKELNQI